MSDLANRIGGMSPKRVALLAIELDERLKALSRDAREPIAVVGMGCRFPGAPDTDAYWRLLHGGVDAISETPRDRWDVDALYDPDPEAPGRIATRWGGFLTAIDGFDAAFFGISPREATTMDPQQRLLLEVAWEALEDAGQSPDRLAGTATGVFVGICNSDYHQLLLERGAESFDMYMATGSAHSVTSGRLSYLLGLQGPSISVDTACSSSLVAFHLACQSIRTGESRMAIAAGVNLLCTPLTTIALSRSRMMAPDGRCKAFDASADGFVRSEGCGVIVLKRLSDALADRDRILALVRGTAANQDGRSSGITAPNGPSQESVIRAALAGAGVTPGEIDFVETHGTGTSLGDPIEVHALGAVFGGDRPANHPLAIGSVKTNIGHLESAAGVAGLIKTILALRNETIPPSLHFRRPNPHIRWEGMPVVVPVTPTPWVRGERPRLAGVSSFGFSGTNVHVVLEEASAAEAVYQGPERPLHVFAISAKSEGALLELASRHAKALETSPASLADVCYTATTGRALLPHRIACASESAEELRGQLETFVGGEVPPRASAGRVRASARTDVAFLCSGQGAQYPGMARRLYETEPAFRTALDRCSAALVGQIERPLLEVIFPPEGAVTPLHEPAYAQPANFAVEYAAAEMWKSWGVVPSVVVGHSLGEFVAACLAGMIGVEDGLRLVATRGRLMQGLPATGAMAAIHAGEARVAEVIGRVGKGASIGALNHPEQTVVSGPRGPVEKVFAAFAAEGVKTEWLRASHGFHSPEMEPIVEPLVRAAREATFGPPRIGFVSTMTGVLLGGNEPLDPGYWGRQVVAPVRYVPAVEELRRLGYGVFLDVGPAPVLAGMGRYCFPEGLWLATIRPGQDEWSRVLESLAALHAAGVGIDWEAFHRPYPRRRVALPTYPFERQRYWATGGEGVRTGYSPTPRAQGPVRPLLGVRLGHPLPTFESRFGIEKEPVLGDHRIGGAAVVPGPVYVEMALAAAVELFGPGPHEIADLRIREAMVIEDGRERIVQTVVTEEGAGRGAFRVYSSGTGAKPAEWRTHVEGRIRPALEEPQAEGALGEARSRCDAPVDVEELRKTLRDRGIEIAAMSAFEAAWRGSGEVLARLRLPEEEGESRFQCDPAVLDAAMLAFAVALSEADGRPADEGYFLVGAERVRILSLADRNLWSHASLRSPEADRPGRHVGDLRLYDDDGALVASLDGLRFQRAEAGTIVRGSGRLNADWFYRVEWEPIPGDPVLARSDRPARPPAEVALERLPEKAKALHAEYRLEEYAEMGKDLDLACAAYAEKAIRRLGWDLSPGAHRTADGIAAGLGIVPRHRRLFGKLLDVLGEEGFLARRGEEWAGTGKPPGPDPDKIVEVLRERHPRLKAQVELTAKCGRRLAAVLRGEEDPLHLLFEGGSFDATEALYRDSPSAQAFNALVREAVSELVGKSLPGGKIRVLEVGAGTGGTSSAVLPVLPPGRTEYSFTDISNAFLVRAREKFADFPFLRFQLLDIERDPQVQGFTPGGFDLVIAANVLHATADMRETLRHVRSLLAPGGSLLLLEGTRTERWVDLTFGLTEGWWRFTDLDLRPTGPALSAEAWRRVLVETGFTAAIVPDDGEGAPGGQPLAVIVAGVPTKEGRDRDLPAAGEKSHRWIVFADRGGTGEEVAGVLRRRGDSCVLVDPGTAYRRSGERFEVDARSPGDIARVLGEAGDGNPLRMLYLWGLDAGEGTGVRGSRHDAETACSMAVSAFRGLLLSGASGKFWILTRGAQKAGPGSRLPECGQAPLWGIGRGIAVEHPDLWGGLVDLDPGTGAGEQAAMAIECACREDGEDQVAVREGKRLAARLVRAPAPAHSMPAVRDDGSYLVTGGLGGLGLKVARWLFDRGARHLVLTGRRGLPGREAWPAIDPNTEQGRNVAAILAMESAGAVVEALAVDASDRPAMERLFARFGGELPELRGVVHAAVAMSQCPLRDLDEATLGGMLASKVGGTRNLLALGAGMPLEFVVLFSSTTALLGARGLAHYAAANGYLDAVAHERRAAGFPVTSVNWGTWDEMRVASAEERRGFLEAGLRPLPSSQALEAMGAVITTGIPQIAVASIDWDALRSLYEARKRRPFLTRLGSVGAKRTSPRPRGSKKDLPSRLKGVSGNERKDVVLAFVQGEVARILGIPKPEGIDPDQGLFDMGLDSLMAVDLKSRLEAGVGQPLPSTLTFNYPSVGALANFLLQDILGSASEPVPVPVRETGPLEEAAAKRDSRGEMSEEDLAALLRRKLDQLS